MRRSDPLQAMRRREIEAWFWIANMVAVAAIYYWLPQVWREISILYLAEVSLWALVAQAKTGRQAANTEAQLRDDIDT